MKNTFGRVKAQPLNYKNKLYKIKKKKKLNVPSMVQLLLLLLLLLEFHTRTQNTRTRVYRCINYFAFFLFLNAAANFLHCFLWPLGFVFQCLI
jgi:predicted membrane protein